MIVGLSLLALLCWIGMLLVTIAGAVLASFAWRSPSRAFVYGAAAAAVLAIILAAVPAPELPFLVGVLLVIAALVLAVLGGGPASVLALRLSTRGSVPDGQHGGILEENGVEVLRGGTVIGLLERAAVAAAILSGYPEALAVIIAIKGVGRFSELDAAETRERFIIGTLVSWIWAAACAAIVVLART